MSWKLWPWIGAVVLVLGAGGGAVITSRAAADDGSSPAQATGATTPEPPVACELDLTSALDRGFARGRHTPAAPDVPPARAAFVGLWKAVMTGSQDFLILNVGEVRPDTLDGYVALHVRQGESGRTIGASLDALPFSGEQSFEAHPSLGLSGGDPRYSFVMRDDLEAIDAVVEYGGAVLTFALARCPLDP